MATINLAKLGVVSVKELVAKLRPVIESIAAEMILSRKNGPSPLDENNVHYSRHVAGSHVKRSGPSVGATSKVAAPAANASTTMSESDARLATTALAEANDIRRTYSKLAAANVLSSRERGVPTDFDRELRAVYKRDPAGCGCTIEEILEFTDAPEAKQAAMTCATAGHDRDLEQRTKYSLAARQEVLARRAKGEQVSFDSVLSEQKSRYQKTVTVGGYEGLVNRPGSVGSNAASTAALDRAYRFACSPGGLPDQSADVQKRMAISMAARELCLSRRAKGEKYVNFDDVLDELLAAQGMNRYDLGEDIAGAKVTVTKGVKEAAVADTLGKGLGSGDVKPTLGPLKYSRSREPDFADPTLPVPMRWQLVSRKR